jgi:hypothetical protein
MSLFLFIANKGEHVQKWFILIKIWLILGSQREFGGKGPTHYDKRRPIVVGLQTSKSERGT